MIGKGSRWVSGEFESIERPMPKKAVGTLHLCLGLLLAGCFFAAHPATAEHKFVGAKKCKVCHGKEMMGDQHSTWRSGPHGLAFQSLSSSRSEEIAQQLGLPTAPNASPECLRCHATADRIDLDNAAYEVKREDGVQCESCHGPGHEYRKKKVMADHDKSMAAGLWAAGRDASICTACHNSESPTFDENRYLLEDGSAAGFDFEQALTRIRHVIPESVKGNYIQLEREAKEKTRREKRKKKEYSSDP